MRSARGGKSPSNRSTGVAIRLTRRCCFGAAVLAVGLFSIPAHAACVEIDGREDRRRIAVTGPILEVCARGLWTVEVEGLCAVGPEGYVVDAALPNAPRVAPPYPLGALLIASSACRVWSYRDFKRMTLAAMMAGRSYRAASLFLRINDGAGALDDNGGPVTLCLGVDVDVDADADGG